MTKEQFLESTLCEVIKRCYVKSCYETKGHHPEDHKVNLYLDRAFYQLNKDNCLADFVTA